jgi:hypothetical protein
VLPRNKYTAIRDDRPKSKEEAKRPEFKECKFTRRPSSPKPRTWAPFTRYRTPRGGDGAWSKVRRLLFEAKPAYAGTSFIETYLLDGDTRHKASAELVFGGSLFAPAPGKGILAHREINGAPHTYVALNKPED